MGQQIIKQPNGKYCIFSTVVDSITHYDCTEEEIIDLFVQGSRVEVTQRVKNQINEIKKGVKSPYRYTYKEALSFIREIHGKSEMENVKSMIEKNTKK